MFATLMQAGGMVYMWLCVLIFVGNILSMVFRGKTIDE